MTRIVYGGVCFTLFFSLVGTILGGVWAIDSWGVSGDGILRRMVP
ncbi:hypothetical protein [Rubritalea tangerina]